MANDTLKFRAATPEDAPHIQNLIQSAFRKLDTRDNWTGSPELAPHFKISVDEVLANIAKPDWVVFVATVDPATTGGGGGAHPVATVQASRRGAGVARLSMLAVDDSRQRGGLGRQVLAHAEDHCRRAWGARRLGLNALSTRGELIACQYMTQLLPAPAASPPGPLCVPLECPRVCVCVYRFRTPRT